MKPKRYHRHFSFLAAMLLAMAVLLSACGGGSGSSGNAGSTGNAGAGNENASGNAGGEQAAEQEKPSIDYPTKTIKLIVPFAAGGGTDVIGRAVADVVSKYLPNGQSVVVENKTGGGGTIGTADVAAAAPDGYTLGLVTVGPVSVTPHLGKTPYTAEDLTPIVNLVNTHNVLVVKADAPWKDFDEWLAYVKENPNQFTYATPGKGIAPHITMEAVNLRAGIQTKGVHFDGTAPALTALLGGHVQGAMVQATEVKTYVESGDIRVLAGTVANEDFPDMAVFKDKGIDVYFDMYTGVVGPKDLPVEIRDILHEAFKQALEDPQVIDTFEKQGIKNGYASPEDFKAMIDNNSQVAQEIIQAIGLE